jgi:hypothetical protein
MVPERPPAEQSERINSPRARIASSRVICKQTTDVIRETLETIKRSLETLKPTPEIDPRQFTDGDNRRC